MYVILYTQTLMQKTFPFIASKFAREREIVIKRFIGSAVVRYMYFAMFFA